MEDKRSSERTIFACEDVNYVNLTGKNILQITVNLVSDWNLHVLPQKSQTCQFRCRRRQICLLLSLSLRIVTMAGRMSQM